MSRGFWGIYLGTKYTGDGYAKVLSRTSAVSEVKALKRGRWLDNQTRFAALEFTAFSPEVGIVFTSTMAVEFPPTGGAIPSTRLSTFKLERYIGPDGVVLFCIEILVLMITLYFSHLTIKRARVAKTGFVAFIANWANLLDITIALMVVVSFTLILVRQQRIDVVLQEFQKNGSPDKWYGGFFGNQGLLQATDTCSAVLLYLATFKFVVLFDHNTKVKRLLMLFNLVATHILGISVILGILFLGFAFMGTLAFGEYCPV